MLFSTGRGSTSTLIESPVDDLSLLLPAAILPAEETPRVDAIAKVSAKAVYTSDQDVPGMLHMALLRSPHAHAQIRHLDTRRAKALPGVAVVLTGADLVDMEPTTGWRYKDWPILARDVVRYQGEHIAAIAAQDEATAFAALDLIDVRYEQLPVAATIDAALAPDSPEIFDRAFDVPAPAFGPGAKAVTHPEHNVCYRFTLEKGDVDEAFLRCDHIFEDSFEFSRAQQFHLEPLVTIAQWQGDSLELWSATQTPFGTRMELARIFRMSPEQIRINVTFVGGGFGSRALIRTEAIAAAAARRAGRPVRLCLSQDESFLTTSQHAAVINFKTGVMADGTLVARQSRMYLNAGAYSDLSPLVCDKAGYRIPSGYRWEALRSDCDAVMTNTVPAGAFRGFGGPQALWAAESQIDMIARRLGIDPYDIRVKNLLRLGEPMVPGESGIDSDLKAGLDLVCEKIGYRSPRMHGRGIGIAVAAKDGGGQRHPAEARVVASCDGKITLYSASVEIGQGVTSALCEIVAKTLDVPRDWISIAAISTDVSPFDMGTVSSTGSTVMGQAVHNAALELRSRLLQIAAEGLGCSVDELTLERWQVVRGGVRAPLRELLVKATEAPHHQVEATGRFVMPIDEMAPHHAKSRFWECGWAAAHVEVDEGTGEVRILQLVVSGDAGKMLNPAAALGQEESAALMGLGQAMFEQMIFENGKLLNLGALKYRVLLAADVPDYEAITQEQGHGPGPFGSKGIGEGTLLGVPAAIANAIHDAVGARVTKVPLSPQNVFEALARRDAATTALRHSNGHLRF
jgi:CO/xanthine dehydrogenase Mo-binding subunit